MRALFLACHLSQIVSNNRYVEMVYYSDEKEANAIIDRRELEDESRKCVGSKGYRGEGEAWNKGLFKDEGSALPTGFVFV